MTAYKYRMPFGIAGDLSRGAGASTVKAEIFGSTPCPTYGIPVKLSAGTVIPVGLVGDTAPYGFLVRPYPTQSSQDPLGVSTPPTSGIANVMLRGFISVKVNAGASSIVEGSPVYIRYASGAPSTPVGGVEGAAVGATTVALTNAYFTGPADADGNAEVAFNI